MSESERRVVITGIGPVSPLGIGREAFLEGLFADRHIIRKVPTEQMGEYRFRTGHYVPTPEFELADYAIPDARAAAMQPEDRMAVLGAMLALLDAGFEVTTADQQLQVDGLPDATDILLGTGLSDLSSAFSSYLSNVWERLRPDPEPDGGFTVKPRYNRLVIPMTMPNSVAVWISMMFGLRGRSYTLNTACASGSYAIGEAYRSIRSGYSDLTITGGVECLRDDSLGLLRGFDGLRTLTTSADGWPLPFSEQRTGFLFAEGAACILVLESLEHARRRGASIYAEILDYQANSDAHNLVQMEPTGGQIKKLLTGFTRHGRIDYLNAHGTGTRTNDQIEAEAITAVFGDRDQQPLINSSKGIMGHSIGASGALEAAVCALALREGRLHHNRVPDPIPNLNLVPDNIETEIELALSTSYGFGGHNAGLLFKRCQEDY
jgi:3-oxoacyl-[acyl-carrier-protein] synthase II